MVLKKSLIIDSSSFINLARVDLLDILKKYFNFIVCFKVKEELFNCLDLTICVPKDILLFKKLFKEKRLKIKDPKYVPKKIQNQLQKQSGELYSIVLAMETNNILIIDDFKPYKYCVDNNILVYNTIEIILLLFDLNEITKKQCLQKILFLKKAIKNIFLLKALDYLNM